MPHTDEQTVVSEKTGKPVAAANKKARFGTVSMEVAGRVVSWGYDGISNGKIEWSKGKDYSKLTGDEKFLEVPNITQSGIYKNAFLYSDLEYTVSPLGIKENIILKDRKANNKWVVRFNLDDLQAVQKDEKTIELFADGDEKPVLVISAPKMVDANGKVSTDLSMQMSVKGSVATITITASRAFLDDKDTAYPVKVDPWYELQTDSSLVAAKFMYDENLLLNWDVLESVYVGYHMGGFGKTCTLIKMIDGFENYIPSDSMITKATLTMAQIDYDSPNLIPSNQYNAYEITSNWGYVPGTFYDYGPRPSTNPNILDYDFGKIQEIKETENGDEIIIPQWLSWDITKTVKKWQNGSLDNYGIMIRANDETIKAMSRFAGIYYYNQEGFRPTFVIQYRSHVGIEDYWSFVSHKAGVNGMGMVNLYTGNLVVTENVFSNKGNRLPYSASIVYNNKQERWPMPTESHPYGYPDVVTIGLGMKLDTDSICVPVSSSDPIYKKGYRYAVTDGDGTRHWFVLKDRTDLESTNPNLQCVDEDGLNLTLTPNVTHSLASKPCVMIEDKKGNKAYYEDNVIIIREDSEGNWQRYYRTLINSVNMNPAWKITRIAESSGRNTYINYSSDFDTSGQMKSITAPDGSVVEFEYTNEENFFLLTEVWYPDGLRTSYEYDKYNRLIRVSEGDNNGLGSSVLYTYVSDSYSNPGFYKVKRVEEHCSEFVNISNLAATRGNYIEFEYGTDNTTRVTDNKGRDEVWQFDNFGRVTSVLNADGSISNAQYAGSTGENGADPNPKANKLSSSTTIFKYVNNLLSNSGMENEMQNWECEQWGDATSGWSVTASMVEKNLGNYSMCVTQALPTPDYAHGFYRYTLPDDSVGKTYTFSADVKIAGAIIDGSGASVYIVPYNSSGPLANPTWGSKIKTTDGGWQRISVTFTVTDSNTQWIQLCAGIDGNGTAYFDNFQLEEGSIPNDYNMIENSSFDIGTDGQMPAGWIGNAMTFRDGKQTTADGNSVMQITGAADKDKNLYQTVKINRPASGTSVSVSVSATGNPIPLREGRNFSVELYFKYTDGTYQWSGRRNLNYDIHDLQNFGFIFTPDSSHSGKTIEYVTVYLGYYRCANTIQFDNIQLNIDNGGNSYGYDSEGNVASMIDLAKNGTNVTYTDANEISTITSPKNHKTSFEYDSTKKHRLITTIAPGPQGDIITENNTFDAYGNVTKTTTQAVSDGLKMETKFTYSHNGNFPATVTDTRGKTSYFEYDGDNGNLLYAADADGEEMEYDYDAVGRVLRIYKDNTGGPPVHSFTYENGRLTTVKTDGLVGDREIFYHFLYDVWGNIASTLVGSQLLLTNTYKNSHGNNGNGNLIKSTYGNGAYVEYDYDKYDRITEKWWNGSAQKIRYTYNNKGQLYEVNDEVNGEKINYTYDLAGRLIRTDRNDGYAFTYGYDEHSLISQNAVYKDGVKKVSQTNVYVQGDIHTSSEFYWDGEYAGKATRNPDSLGRTASGSVYSAAGDFFVAQTADYVPRANGTTSNLINSMNNEIVRDGAPNLTISSHEYTYDDLGNITSITDLRTGYTTYYEYDWRYQLVREDNQAEYSTYIYEYDYNGNIIYIDMYPYVEPGEMIPYWYYPERIAYYEYNDSNWGEKLTSYNGQAITYDAIGNPLSYINGWTFTWQRGRQLATAVKTGYNMSYKYNDSGLRIQKTVNGVATDYLWDGSQLIMQKTGNDEIWYQYDGNGEVRGFIYNGTRYIYVKNAQGDIIALVDDTTGSVVAKYTYNAWGESVSITDGNGNDISSNASHIANINPLRYRGYYYDSETGLFYVGSRYYDPEIGRFINADSQLNPQEGFTGYNMFQYCGNNPVNRVDPTGHAFMFLTAAIGAVAGAVVGGVIAAAKGKSVVKGALIGAAVGGLVGLGAGAAAGVLLAGSATASTAAVMTGGSALVATVSTGGLGAGVTYVANNISQAVSKAAPAVQAGTNKMADVVTKGKAGEAAANIVKNTARIPSLSGTAAYRIPDGLDTTMKILSEVKNYSGTLSYTSQLRDFVSWSSANGYQMHLYTNARLSGPLQQAVDSGLIQLFPLG